MHVVVVTEGGWRPNKGRASLGGVSSNPNRCPFTLSTRGILMVSLGGLSTFYGVTRSLMRLESGSVSSRLRQCCPPLTETEQERLVSSPSKKLLFTVNFAHSYIFSPQSNAQRKQWSERMSPPCMKSALRKTGAV